MVYKGGKANRSPSCVFVGNLPDRVDERDIHDLFDKFGEIKDVDIKHGKTSNYTSYAFIEFASVRSAEDAVDSRDGYEYDRYRLRVEFAGEKKPRRYPSYDRPRDRDRSNRYPPPTRTDYRLVISNLPHGCRWQHLKDHMRKAGPVGYVNIVHGKGFVDYMHKSDMKYAIRKLDGSELTTPDDSCRIRVKKDEFRRSRSRHRSYDRRSRSVSDRRSRSVRSGSPYERRSRSISGKRSRSERSRSPYDRRSRTVSDRRSRSVRSVSDRSRSPYAKRQKSRDRSGSERARTRSRSASERRSYERSRSDERLKLNSELEPMKHTYDRDAETETAAETYRESPLKV
uniref:Splicing factor (SR protein), putative n=1 Tax=Theileria annulata TaxID=5874 RepID=A0A3B0MV89_THEAN